MFGLSVGHLIVVLLIVAMLFGTKKLRNVGQDLGEAIRGFKKGMSGDDATPTPQLKTDAGKDDTSGKPDEPKV